MILLSEVPVYLLKLFTYQRASFMLQKDHLQQKPNMAAPICVISKQTGRSTSNASKIHSVPCKIDYSGPAQVSGYFVQQEVSDGKLKAAFRGHGLEGIKLDLPSEYELCVLKKRNNEQFDIEARQQSFMLWETGLMRLLYALSLIISLVEAEPISLLTGAAVMIGGGALWKFQHQIKCKLFECCDKPYVSPRFDKLHNDLYELVYGQHLVLDTVENAIRAHWTNENPKKPLAMSFHGFTGSGKNYVAEIIANSTFKNGMRSNFVHHIVATADYPDKNKLNEYRLRLRERILNGVSKCNRALFIFDEADKLPEQLLEAVKPFLDYYDSVGGVDFRKSTFLFLSNRGGNLIANVALSHYQSGSPREDLTLNNFERMLMQAAYNEPGGLKLCELISSHLIDHFVPFLPMERRHIYKCTVFYLRAQGREDLAKNDELVQRIVDSLQYFPKGKEIFSSSGCKRIAAKSDLEISKETLPSFSIKHLTFDDEL
ncbi:Torsin [Oesophagostomum dentatum]|uniref:Torsin n=1 Tax=Oesophagostomum dentatum TaxID=61180 RepID=A0A0B1STW1_OESDE|nr:Torsin [Oesophagostomum dentatum]